MNKNLLITSFLAFLAVSGCARREETEPAADAATSQAAKANTRQEIEKQAPAATIAPVNVQVTLTPAAEAALRSKSEKVMVVAAYSGDPRASEQAQKLADASGTIKLGENKQLIDGAGSLTFQDDVIDKSRLGFTFGEVQVTINVTSSKSSTPENLLACPFYWETLAEASKQTVKIDCKAMSEVQH